MADLSIEMREGFGLASVMARKHIGSEQIGAALGVEAPVSAGMRTGAGGLSLIGTGQGTWLAYADLAVPMWANGLRERLTGLASVSDQSSGYVIFRLKGADARRLLQRGMAIDLHPDRFGPGSAATTVISHIGAIVWQLDDHPTYEVATFRSYSESFRHWLDQVVATF